MSIITILTTFIKLYNPKHVIFVGFSLGSALALAASYIIHKSLATEEENIVKPLFSVYQFCGIKIVDVLKMDVQGFELEVLKGATNILPKIKVIVFEINNHQGFKIFG